MFYITNENINDFKANSGPEIDTVGGIVSFQGTVRNHNEGHKVKSLEYESYTEMANKVGEKIVADAKEKFDIVDAVCVHRVGHLAIGDTAVWVYAFSHHRREAFEACQYIIDTVKDVVPIWKKEHYVDKDPEWVACHRCAEHAHENHQHHGHSHE